MLVCISVCVDRSAFALLLLLLLFIWHKDRRIRCQYAHLSLSLSLVLCNQLRPQHGGCLDGVHRVNEMVLFFDRQRFDRIGIDAVQLQKYALFLMVRATRSSPSHARCEGAREPHHQSRGRQVMAVVTAMFSMPSSLVVLFVNTCLLSVAFVGAFKRNTSLLLVVRE